MKKEIIEIPIFMYLSSFEHIGKARLFFKLWYMYVIVIIKSCVPFF